MKALQIFILFAIFSSALATASADEIAALVNLRTHIPQLNYYWTDEKLLHMCEPGTNTEFITCSGGHVTTIDLAGIFHGGSYNGPLGNISGLTYLESLTIGPFTPVPNLDAWYTQLPSLISLSISHSKLYNHSRLFSGDFSKNPRLTTFSYTDDLDSTLTWKIRGAPGLKLLNVSVPNLISFSSDFLTGFNQLTHLSFFTTGKETNLQKFPDFSHLTYLETLDMSRTAIRELPDTFSQLANLRVLKLDFCFNLTKIASSVSNCVKLESISCNNCKLNRADSLPNLSSTRLNQLLLPENNIRTVWPIGLCQLSTNPLAPGLTLDLLYNFISDPPACFARTVKLYSIAFFNPNFASFPTYLANMSSLTSLTFTYSRKTVYCMPDFSGTSLVTLDLSYSGLVGTLPSTLPASLNSLRLIGNNLTGTISDNFFASFGSLSTLSLMDNKFSGAFPSSIGVTNITTLAAYRNGFTSIPNSIGNLSLLGVHFQENNLKSIPPEEVWEKLDKLYFLDLHDNRDLSGPLPVFWSKCRFRVMHVDLSGCSFTGNVPSLNSTTLRTLKLSDNALDGIIMPSENAASLYFFGVDRNRLTGTIPPSLGRSSYVLSTFDVSFNRLTGSIPSTFQSLFDKGTLTRFSFNNNGINGPLPNLTLATSLHTFKGDHTKVSLCDANPNIRSGSDNPDMECSLTDVAFPGTCGCESWYTFCNTTTVACPAPGYVAPVDPPGTSAPTPILPPNRDPVIPPGESFEEVPFSEESPDIGVSKFTCPVPTPQVVGPAPSIQFGSAVSIATSLTLIICVSVLGLMSL